jgi:tetratricopeptide (TPR) repeat protein
MKRALILIIAAFLLQLSFAQTDTIRGEAAKQLVRQIIDTTKFLNNVGTDACKCIDSITLTNKSSKDISADIFTCIDKEVTSYQLAMKVYHNMTDKGNNNTISLNSNKNTAEYKRYYFKIERWLIDSCASLKKAAASDNKESHTSTSSDPVAIDYYNKGIREMDKENFTAALALFEKAVKQDDVFAFAWDNIGICKRKLGDLNGALEAYLKSLQLDPKGRLPLQNIPVVYEYKKDYDKALEAYQALSKVYPDDPEAYYGSGRMYELKNDYEKALDHMCKAYNAYIALNSPYRSDAEKNINIYYKKLKDLGKEEQFYKILKDNHIKTN